jgi:hypothetical protein
MRLTRLLNWFRTRLGAMRLMSSSTFAQARPDLGLTLPQSFHGGADHCAEVHGGDAGACQGAS